ncbi:MAG: PcfJ domain-containing protein [Lachnospiraceae bacterium]|nr:PcfJ domain-containing protein [Lachnospiraceae bacterium]
MTKRERAAGLIENFPDLRQEDVDRCMERMPHHILFRHDRSEGRCNYCGNIIADFRYLAGLVHGVKTHCPECGEEGFALCDCYNYSGTVDRGSRNFVIFAKGEGDICYAHCIRIRIRLDREIGGYAVEDYYYTETQRYIFTQGLAYRYGREKYGYHDPRLNRAVFRYSPWTYREKYTEPTWDEPGFHRTYGYIPLNDDEVGGTCLQYAQLDSFDRIALFKYIKFYLKHPNVEHLIKQGFADKVQSWFGAYAPPIPDWIDWKQSDVRKMLGMNAAELRSIRERKIDMGDYHRIRQNLPYLSMEECFTYLPIIRNYWGYLSIYEEPEQRRILKYLRRQNARYAAGNTFVSIGDYHDYMHECRELRYDWDDREIRFPRCLAAAHTRTSEAVHAIRAEQRRLDAVRAAERQKAAAEQANRFREQLGFDNGNLSVCVPASAAAIVDEGKALHHCVGGYAARHVTGALHILFIRRDSARDKPYFTMEVSTEGVVIQVRGLRNCDPPEEVRQLVESYKDYIRPLFAKQRKTERVRVSA